MNLARRLVAACCLVLTACAAGPDFERPKPPDVKSYTDEPPAGIESSVSGQRLVTGAAVPERWWEAFQSPRLDALIARALAANPTLEVTRAALRVAQQNVAAQQGAFWPQVNASISPTRQEIARSISSPLNSGAQQFSLHTAQLSVSYVADVFGANRRLVEALQAQADAQNFQLYAARDALAANLVAAAVSEAALRGQVAAAERIVACNEEILDLTRRQRTLGAAPVAAVLAQQSALAQAQQALAATRKQLAQTRDMRVALGGGYPDQAGAEFFELGDFRLPAELPVSLPSRLVERRPDVRAAEAQLHAASAGIGVATANMLPQIALNANIGSVATQMADLYKAGTGFWSVAGVVAQPLFAGGTLMHRREAAKANYDQARAQYQATVVTAFQGVADALHALRQDAEANRAAQAAAQAASQGMDIARKQFAVGDISRMSLLNAELSFQLLQIARAQAEAGQLADSAALFLMLGGGWRDDDGVQAASG